MVEESDIKYDEVARKLAMVSSVQIICKYSRFHSGLHLFRLQNYRFVSKYGNRQYDSFIFQNIYSYMNNLTHL